MHIYSQNSTVPTAQLIVDAAQPLVVSEAIRMSALFYLVSSKFIFCFFLKLEKSVSKLCVCVATSHSTPHFGFLMMFLSAANYHSILL